MKSEEFWEPGQARTVEGDLDPNAIANDIDHYGKAWAHKKHAADALEKTTRAVLAQLTNAIRKKNLEMSRKEAEDGALGSDDYINHLYITADARREANIARVEYDVAQARFEAIRSAEATRRIEINTLSRRN